VKHDQYLSLFSEPGSNSIAMVAVDMLRAQLRAIFVSIADPSYAPRDIKDVLDFPRLFGSQLHELREFVRASLSNDTKPVVLVTTSPQLLDLASPLVATLFFLAREGACSTPFSFIKEEISTKVLLEFEQTANPIARSLAFRAALPRLVPADICQSYAMALFGEQISPIHVAYSAVEIETDELARVFLDSGGEVQSSHDIVHLLNNCFIAEDDAKQLAAMLKRQESEGATGALNASSSHVRISSDEWLARQSLASQINHENSYEAVVSGTEAFFICATNLTPHDDFKISIPLRYAISQRKHVSIGENNARKIALLDICRTWHLRLQVSSLFYDLHASDIAYRLASQYAFDDLVFPTASDSGPDEQRWEQTWAKMLIDMQVYERDTAKFFRDTLDKITDGRNIHFENITNPLHTVLFHNEEVTLFNPSEGNQVSQNGAQNDISAHIVEIAERYRGWRLSSRYIFETLGRFHHQALRAERDKDFNTAIAICQKAIEYAKNHPAEKILSGALSRLFGICAQLCRLAILRSTPNLVETRELAELMNATPKQLPDIGQIEELAEYLQFALSLCDNLFQTSFDPCVNDKRLIALCLLSSLFATNGRLEESDQILSTALSLISVSPAGKIRYTHLLPLAQIKFVLAGRVLEEGDESTAQMTQSDKFLKEALECVESYETRGVSEASQQLRSLISTVLDLN
jgi:hypothetical protein